MKRLSVPAIALALFAAGCGSSTSPSQTAPSKPTFTATILPANETPPIANAENVGSGTATITFDLTNDASGNVTAATATFLVSMVGFPSSTVINIAHIHTGASGVPGPILVNTTLAPGDVTLSNGQATFTKANINMTADTATAIMNNPAGFYFNVHTAQNPGGVARGQLVRTQ